MLILPSNEEDAGPQWGKLVEPLAPLLGACGLRLSVPNSKGEMAVGALPSVQPSAIILS
jgi:hypothetical protein